MAQKRMFSKDIVDSDAFLDMPLSAQALYFHLGMAADDDGFIGNPRRIQRVIGCNDDDLKVLLGKKFLIAFPSGVIVIKHHRMNNNWDKYNCKRTTYLEEFSQLFIKDNKAYTLDKTQGEPLQSDSSLGTVFRIEENRIEEKRREKKDADKSAYGEFSNVFLKEEEYTKLVKALDENSVKVLIAELDGYIESKGKKYKSHYATLQNWARRRINDHVEKIKSSKNSVAF